MNEEMHHPLLARLLHWSIVVSMLMMLLTGLYIHDPGWMPLFSSIGVVWPLHYIFGIALVTLVFFRIVYSGTSGDIDDLIMKPEHIRDLGPVLKYYLFLHKKEPQQGKYNAGQRMTYSLVWVPLLLVQVVTGIGLYILVGAVVLRVIHYIVTWLFIVTVLMHIYLGAVHGWHVIRSMITGKLSSA
ncbi:MAG: cytochrome b/b6 domain-containing protein [Chloroflexota bacterium]|nr:cytochrome b/b6 domain-containing protein [Chloroflexota bacterium]